MGDIRLFGEIKADNAATEDAQRRRLAAYEMPESAMGLAAAFWIVAHEWGYLRSIETKQPVDASGRPTPMYSYALLEYLAGLDLSDKAVFEFGAGNSTLYWAQRARFVHAVENDPAWAERLKRQAPANCRIDLVKPGGMAGHFRRLDARFDIIVVDCAENRYECCAAVHNRLSEGGGVILDNSDWYPNSARILREAGLLQVDFHGLRPCHHYACTSSFFMHRAFAPKPMGQRLPRPPIGGKRIVALDWDRPAEPASRGANQPSPPERGS